MTLLTPTYLLPYQTGADAPCDAPDVWCQFAALANDVMTSAKNVIDRIEPTVPLAVVESTTLTNVPINGSGLVGWDSVLADTDRMVDFDTSRFFVFPRRTGVYSVSIRLLVYSVALGLNDLVTLVSASAATSWPVPFAAAGGFGFNAGSQDDVGSFAPGSQNFYYIRTEAVYDVDSSFVNINTFNQGGFATVLSIAGAGDLNIVSARMGVYWVREVV